MRLDHPVARIRDLSVTFCARDDTIQAVKNVTFDIDGGQTLCIVGESGSGKSVTSLALTRLTDFSSGACVSGHIVFNSQSDGSVDFTSATGTQLAALRGKEIGMVFQDPSVALNPVLTLGRQLTEGMIHHLGITQKEANQRAISWLERTQVPDPKLRMRQYPHELSGGLRQRVTIAMALACNPHLLIADEPTTALDVTVQREILALLSRLKAELNLALIVITHDMGVVAQIADQVVVMQHGTVVESGDVTQIFEAPCHPHTKMLIDALPVLGARKEPQAEPSLNDPILKVRDLCVRYPVRQGVLRRTVARVHAVEDVTFDIPLGKTLGLVGESGSGKTSVGKAILRLIDPFSGKVMIEKQDVTSLRGDALHRSRQDMQMIFQDPASSLNPLRRLVDQVAEPLQNFHVGTKKSRNERVKALFENVQLPGDLMSRYPHEVSGGQRQRVAIARALALNPKLIVADEAVSALDTNVQAHVLRLLHDLQSELGLSYLFISHDLAVVERISHQIAVMYRGRIVEKGPTRAILDNPQHAYTRSLIGAVLPVDPRNRMDLDEFSHKPVSSPTHPIGFKAPASRYHKVDAGHFVLTSECGYET